MNEVVTIMEAEVKESNWKLLEATYKKETSDIPATIRQTFLLQSQKEPLKWLIVTHWRSQEDLDQMRFTEKVPVAIRIFKAANAAPTLEIWNSRVHHHGPKLQ